MCLRCLDIGISDAPPPAQDETPGEEEDQDGAGEDAEEKVGRHFSRAIVENAKTTL